MPKESRLLMNPGETLLGICLDTHMGTTGSSDPLSTQDTARNLKILSTAILYWKKDSDKWKRFDDAVLELCRATVAEVE